MIPFLYIIRILLQMHYHLQWMKVWLSVDFQSDSLGKIVSNVQIDCSEDWVVCICDSQAFYHLVSLHNTYRQNQSP